MVKTIALVDWSASGHHPLYFKNFALSLSQAQVDVVPFCPNPAEFQAAINDFSSSTPLRSTIFPAQSIAYPCSSGFRPARFRHHFDTYNWFRSLGNYLRAWERRNNHCIDVVFFACIYDLQFEYFRLAESAFRYPWCGLYLHARSFRMPGSVIPHSNRVPSPEKIFSSSLLRSVAVLDEKAIQPLQQIAGGKPVFAFPDFTEQSLPSTASDFGLINKIRSFANGKPIISLLGHLHWTKGIDLFTQAAISPVMQDCLFFIGGEVSWDGIPPETKAHLQQCWEQAPNVFTHLQRISSDQVLNSLIDGSDIIFAAYRSFPNSSNILTKAAVFKKPIVVSDGYLMAERVSEYRLGEVIPEGNLRTLNAALLRLLEPKSRISLHEHARWDDYQRHHSTQRLTEAMAELVAVL